MSIPEPPAPTSRPLLAPPPRLSGLARDLFWNDSELRAGWRLLIYFLLFRELLVLGVDLIGVLHLPRLTATNVTAPAILFQDIVLFSSAVAAAVVMKFLEGRPFGAYGLPLSQAFGARFWHGSLWGLAMISASILLIRLLGGFSAGSLALHGKLIVTYAILWGFTFLCVGFAEEFLFRGYAQFTLTTGLRFWPAATLLSASFGLIHRFNPGEGWVGALSVFVIAMFFCLTLRRTGSLWFAVGAHAAFDWGETFLYSVPDSGLVAPGHLLNSSFHGARWLTGGTIGPEGSIMVFVVIAIAALIFNFMYPSREQD